MGFGDKMKNLAKQAQESVAEHREQIHNAVEAVGAAADQKTHGKYTAKIAKFGEKAGGAVDKFAGHEDEAEAGAAGSTGAGASESAAAGTPADEPAGTAPGSAASTTSEPASGASEPITGFDAQAAGFAGFDPPPAEGGAGEQ